MQTTKPAANEAELTNKKMWYNKYTNLPHDIEINNRSKENK